VCSQTNIRAALKTISRAGTSNCDSFNPRPWGFPIAYVIFIGQHFPSDCGRASQVTMGFKMAWSKSTRIKVMIAIDTAFFLLELISGFLAHSLALTADAFHMVCIFWLFLLLCGCFLVCLFCLLVVFAVPHPDIMANLRHSSTTSSPSSSDYGLSSQPRRRRLMNLHSA
jgi:hypothetical protein